MSKAAMISLGVALWVSFLSAAVATMIFFATFDPTVIAQFATYPMDIDRHTGYSIGFLLFWVLLLANSLTVVWLTRHRSE